MSAPALSEAEEQIIVQERLRLLAIGYYVKGAVGAIFVSFIPESAWNPQPKSATTIESLSVTPSPSPRPVNQGPPVIIFRMFAAVIGVIILLGWTFGGLTIYAGRCVQKRTNRRFVYVIAALNCPFIPWGTLLGVATFILLQTPVARREFELASEDVG